MAQVVTRGARFPLGWNFKTRTGWWSVEGRLFCRPVFDHMAWMKRKAHRAERKIARTKCRQMVNGSREDFGFHVAKVRVTERDTD